MNFRELMLEQKRLILDTSHLSESRNAVLGREIIDVPVKTDTPQSATPCIATWAITDVSKVRSLEAEGFIITFIKSNWSTVRNGWQNVIKDLKDPEKGIENDKHIWKSISDEEKQIILNFTDGTTTDPQISPWNYVIKNLADEAFEPQEYVYTLEGHKKSIARHNEMLSKLKNPQLGSFKTVLNQFKDILCTYNKDGVENGGFISVLLKYKIENGASDGKSLFNRFDEFFKDDTTTKILGKINELYKIRITPSELKALQMKETGDYTNITIAGIDPDPKAPKKGITSKRGTSGEGIVGICQLPVDAAKDAVDWAKGATIEIGKDRTIPKNAVHLTAAYLGYLLKLIANRMPYINDCLSKKLILFASYNGGHVAVNLAIDNYVSQRKSEVNKDKKNKKDKINETIEVVWNDDKFQETLKSALWDVFIKIFKDDPKDKKGGKTKEQKTMDKQKETKEYPSLIAKRLTIE